MTAARAIVLECQGCVSHRSGSGICGTRVCALSPDVWEGARSRVKQIRAHCLDCAGSFAAVADCDGVVLRGGVCYLHPYRFGRNPGRRKGVVSEKSLEALRKLRPTPEGEGSNRRRIDAK